jgi:transposase InsO family protein
MQLRGSLSLCCRDCSSGAARWLLCYGSTSQVFNRVQALGFRQQGCDALGRVSSGGGSTGERDRCHSAFSEWLWAETARTGDHVCAQRALSQGRGIIAFDLFVVVTTTFRLLYVFVVIEHHSRRLIHCNVTAHPSADWTLQQLREAVGFEERYAYLLHDRDSIFSNHLDDSIGRLGVKVLRSPPRSPMANSICERVIGAIRRECVDWVIPLSECHLRRILKSWIPHYNTWRPHMALVRVFPIRRPPCRPPASRFAPSPRRILCGSCQSDPRRVASRILSGAGKLRDRISADYT